MSFSTVQCPRCRHVEGMSSARNQHPSCTHTFDDSVRLSSARHARYHPDLTNLPAEAVWCSYAYGCVENIMVEWNTGVESRLSRALRRCDLDLDVSCTATQIYHMRNAASALHMSDNMDMLASFRHNRSVDYEKSVSSLSIYGTCVEVSVVYHLYYTS